MQDYSDNRRLNVAGASTGIYRNLLKKRLNEVSIPLERALPFRRRAGRDRFGHARLETNNDESRFGLTRAPFLKRRGSLERGQSLVRHRVAKSGIEST